MDGVGKSMFDGMEGHFSLGHGGYGDGGFIGHFVCVCVCG